MPTGTYVRRYAYDGFQPHLSTKHREMYFWMDWISIKESIKISHFVNSGTEKRVGPYLCDGSYEDTVFEVR